MIPESFIEELRYRTDIGDLISRYLPLKRSGRNMTGLCPFHSERSPSFVVYQENQSFYCFGCGAGGDAITFVKRIENLGYVDAIKFLADRCGMTVPEDAVDDRASRMRMRVLELNRVAAKYYHQVLISPLGKAGLDYLRERGLSQKTITKFGLGFAPDGWDGLKKHLEEQGFTLEEMVTATVVTMNNRGSGYDSLRNRVVFPIIDLRGNVVGFGGRALGDQKPKYLNSSDSPVFKKSRNLYGMNFAKSSKSGHLMLMEGYMDVISVVQGGFDSAVATLGTALTAEQARLIAQYTDEVIICYDADGAGQTATAKATLVLKEVGIKVRVLQLEGAKDPDEYIKKFGSDRFRLLLSRSEGSIEYRLRKLTQQFDLETSEGKVDYLKAFCGVMAEISNPIEMEIYVTKTARELSVSKETLLDTIDKRRKNKKRSEEKKSRRDLKTFSQISPLLQRDHERNEHMKYAVVEERVIATLIRFPEYFKDIRSWLLPEDFVTSKNKAIYTILYARLSEGQGIEPMLLSGLLNEDEMARISYMMANYGSHHYSKEELREFGETLLSYKNLRSTQEIVEMSAEEWVEYMKNLSKGKK